MVIIRIFGNFIALLQPYLQRVLNHASGVSMLLHVHIVSLINGFMFQPLFKIFSMIFTDLFRNITYFFKKKI